MKHDPFEFDCTEMTWWDKAVRILFLAFVVGVLLCDLFIWRP